MDHPGLVGETMTARAVRPARFWYLVAGAVLAGSVVWFVLWLVLGVRSMSREVDGFQRVPVPGEATVSFARPGGYVLYFEGPLAAQDQFDVPLSELSLVSASGGEAIPIRPYGGSMTYDFSGHEGRAIGTFQINEPGSFLLHVNGDTLVGQANIAVGPSIGGGIVRTVLLGLVGAAVLAAGGVILVVVTAVRRNRSRRSLSRADGPWVPVGAAAPGGWFADPSGRHERRYWDGEKWTAHVSDGGNQTVDPP